MHTIDELRQKQSLPLDIKIKMTEQRIIQWVDNFGIDNVYVSFSGGKDSTVLLDIAYNIYPGIKAMFVDTGLEYPEIRDFVKAFENVDIIRPKMNFKQVIEKYGYPFISKEVSQKVYDGRMKPEGYTKKYFIPASEGGKESHYNMAKYKPLLTAPFTISHKCCFVMKKTPAKKYYKENNRVPITGETAEESVLRTSNWLRHGCNAYDTKTPVSKPLSFWTEQDILKYIYIKNLKIASVYGKVIEYKKNTDFDNQIGFEDLNLIDKSVKYKTTGCQRTGCMFCGFGCHIRNDERFLKMKETHPKQYDFIMKAKEDGGLNYKEVIDWLNDNLNLNIRY